MAGAWLLYSQFHAQFRKTPMTVIEMKILNPKRDERPYVVPDFVGPVITGGGEATYCCGRCRTVLLESVDWGRVQDIAIRCAKCRKINGVPDPNAPAKKKGLFRKA